MARKRKRILGVALGLTVAAAGVAAAGVCACLCRWARDENAPDWKVDCGGRSLCLRKQGPGAYLLELELCRRGGEPEAEAAPEPVLELKLDVEDTAPPSADGGADEA